MFLFAGFVPLVVLATGLVADPSLAHDSLLVVPISKRTNFDGVPDFSKRDREHLRNLAKRSSHRRRSSTADKAAHTPLNNTGGIYVATIGVGSPPTNCESCKFPLLMVSYILSKDQLLVDSGSAITWVGANKHYVETTSSVKTKESVVSIRPHDPSLKLNPVRQDITYSNGFFKGKFTS